MIHGLILFVVGLGLFTIGGFITMTRHPKLTNDKSRLMLEPVRKDIPRDADAAFDRALLSDPKAKWFTRLGLALVLSGMAVFYFSQERNTGQTSGTITNTKN